MATTFTTPWGDTYSFPDAMPDDEAHQHLEDMGVLDQIEGWSIAQQEKANGIVGARQAEARGTGHALAETVRGLGQYLTGTPKENEGATALGTLGDPLRAIRYGMHRLGADKYLEDAEKRARTRWAPQHEAYPWLTSIGGLEANAAQAALPVGGTVASGARAGASILGSAARGALTGGATGTAMGATAPLVGDESRMQNAAVGGGTGAILGGLLGGGTTAAGKAIQRYAQPFTDKLDQIRAAYRNILLKEGVQPDAAQMTNSRAAGILKRAAGDSPYTGGPSLPEQQGQQVTAAILRKMGIGNAPHATKGVMDAGRQVLQDTYNDTLDRINVYPDDQMASDYGRIYDRTQAAESVGGADVRKLLDRLRYDMIQNGNRLTGDVFQKLNSDMELHAGNPQVQPLIEDVRQMLSNAIQRQAAPEDVARLAMTDSRYAAMRAIDQSIRADKSISPGRLWAQLNAQSTNRVVYGRGNNQDLVDLTAAAHTLLGGPESDLDLSLPMRSAIDVGVRSLGRPHRWPEMVMQALAGRTANRMVYGPQSLENIQRYTGSTPFTPGGVPPEAWPPMPSSTPPPPANTSNPANWQGGAVPQVGPQMPPEQADLLAQQQAERAANSRAAAQAAADTARQERAEQRQQARAAAQAAREQQRQAAAQARTQAQQAAAQAAAAAGPKPTPPGIQATNELAAAQREHNALLQQLLEHMRGQAAGPKPAPPGIPLNDIDRAFQDIPQRAPGTVPQTAPAAPQAVPATPVPPLASAAPSASGEAPAARVPWPPGPPGTRPTPAAELSDAEIAQELDMHQRAYSNEGGQMDAMERTARAQREHELAQEQTQRERYGIAQQQPQAPQQPQASPQMPKPQAGSGALPSSADVLEKNNGNTYQALKEAQKTLKELAANRAGSSQADRPAIQAQLDHWHGVEDELIQARANATKSAKKPRGDVLPKSMPNTEEIEGTFEQLKGLREDLANATDPQRQEAIKDEIDTLSSQLLTYGAAPDEIAAGKYNGTAAAPAAAMAGPAEAERVVANHGGMTPEQATAARAAASRAVSEGNPYVANAAMQGARDAGYTPPAAPKQTRAQILAQAAANLEKHVQEAMKTGGFWQGRTGTSYNVAYGKKVNAEAQRRIIAAGGTPQEPTQASAAEDIEQERASRQALRDQDDGTQTMRGGPQGPFSSRSARVGDIEAELRREAIARQRAGSPGIPTLQPPGQGAMDQMGAAQKRSRQIRKDNE